MTKNLVTIVMGSDSDLPVMQESALALDEFSIGYDIIICSAHRLPEKTAKLAKEAAGEGKKVIIAGAGGAAHLAGVIASMTTLPVIAVPMKTSGLGGADSLYSMVQMPRGIPVATVAINGAYNAGLLAAQIIALSDNDVLNKFVQYKEKMAEGVLEKDRLLQEKGFPQYIKEKLSTQK